MAYNSRGRKTVFQKGETMLEITKRRKALGLTELTLESIQKRVTEFTGANMSVNLEEGKLRITKLIREQINILADTTQDWEPEYREAEVTMLLLDYKVPGWGGKEILYEYIGKTEHIGLGGWERGLQLEEFLAKEKQC